MDRKRRTEGPSGGESYEEVKRPSKKSASTSSTIEIPLRPGKGTLGTKCIVKANHFFLDLPNKELYHYDVSSSLNGW